MWIGVGRLGRTEFEIEVIGKSCHGADASISGLSINAVHEATILQNALLNEYLNKKCNYIDGPLEISSSQYISSSEGGRAILSVPEYAKFTIDKSFIPGEIAEDQIKEITDIIKELQSSGLLNKDTQIKISERERPTPPCKPYALKLESETVQKITSILERLNIEPRYGIGRSVADENKIAETGIPTLILSPNGQGSHTNEEWVDSRSLEQLELVYKNLVENW
jgi:acetylornithine deacetylase/succinyl-diaminopimelate desuccinylase-like protein